MQLFVWRSSKIKRVNREQATKLILEAFVAIKNVSNFRTVEAWFERKVKNNEPQPKFTGSYKNVFMHWQSLDKPSRDQDM